MTDRTSRWRAFARGRDVGLVYAAVVLVSAVVEVASDHAEDLVLSSSTNVHNLHDHPVLVLVLSAFVLSSPWGLWVVPVLVWVFGAAQRWLGRAATVVTAALGHVFASVFVGVLLTAGLAHHQLSRRIAHEPDVGVSYGLAALGGLLVFRLPPRARRRVAAGVTLLLVLLVAVSQTFTDLGHLLAWLVGLALGLVGSRMAGAGRRPQVTEAS